MKSCVRFFSTLIFPLIIWGLCACSSNQIIVNGLQEREANEIIVLLASKGIHSEKIAEKSSAAGGAQAVQLWDIAVPSTEAVEAMSILNANGLPKKSSQSLLNIFAGGSLVPSAEEQKIRYEAGLAAQIASTIRKIDGVIDADVQISFPEENPLQPGTFLGSPSASVFVKHNGVLDDPNLHLVSKVKNLVASSVPGLTADNVSVIGDRIRAPQLPSTTQAEDRAAEHDYVQVFSVVVAKESLSRFQVIFFSFCLIILLLALFVAWFWWKTHLLLRKRGGIKALVHFSPLTDDMGDQKGAKDEKSASKDAAKDAKSQEAQDTAKQAASKEPKVQENIENPDEK